MIKGAIFDFDGTLVDSMFIWDTFGEDYLRTLGKEPRENLTETFKTFTLEQAAEYYREHYGVTLSVGEIVDGVNEMVSEIYRTKVTLKSGVLEFILYDGSVGNGRHAHFYAFSLQITEEFKHTTFECDFGSV